MRDVFDGLIVVIVVSMLVRVASVTGVIKNSTAARVFGRVGRFGSRLNRLMFALSFVALLVIVILLLAHMN